MNAQELEKIKDLRDYAELAWASYSTGLRSGMFRVASKGDRGEITDKEYDKLPTYFQALQKDDYKVGFSAKQTYKFVERYKAVYHHIDDWKNFSGFSATLFEDTMKDRYIVAFRGTNDISDFIQDIGLTIGINLQQNDLLQFMESIKPFLQSQIKPIIFVGHSLGGYLAQWALIYCDNPYKNKFGYSPKEVYTFNAPSIHSWFSPSLFTNINLHKLYKEFSGKLTIDISRKLTHIYDDGGINIIASAQYGSSNKLPLYTRQDSHSIIYLTLILQEAIAYFSASYNANKILDDFVKHIKYGGNYIPAIYDHEQTKKKEREMQPTLLNRIKWQLNKILYIPMPNPLGFYAPMLPTPSNALQESIAYLQSNPKPQKPQVKHYASANTWTKEMLEDIENQRDYEIKNQEYQTHLKTYESLQASYKRELRNYEKNYDAHQGRQYVYYRSVTENLAGHIALQLPKEISNYDRFSENDLDFYTLLDSLHSHQLYYTYIDSKEIENLNLQDLQDESKLGYFYCLYTCNPLLVLDNENNTTLNNKVITQNFGYRDDFYLSFISNKDSLDDTYLQARKDLYATVMLLRDEREQDYKKQQEYIEQQLQGLDSKQRESKLRELQREYTRKQIEQQRQEK